MPSAYRENWPPASETTKDIPSGEKRPSTTWMTGGAQEPRASGGVSAVENLQERSNTCGQHKPCLLPETSPYNTFCIWHTCGVSCSAGPAGAEADHVEAYSWAVHESREPQVGPKGPSESVAVQATSALSTFHTNLQDTLHVTHARCLRKQHLHLPACVKLATFK